MANELLIKINADAKNAQKEFDNIIKQTEDLEGQLNKAALVSGAAFAALTAEVYFADKAFREASKSAIQLNAALQNQGIFTQDLVNEYKKYAVAVQNITGIDDDVITKSQAIAQGFLGQTKITEELTLAIANYGAYLGGDLNTAAQQIGRTIGTTTNGFLRQGLVISDTMTKAERYEKVLEFVRQKSNGMAEAFNRADGYAKALETSFGNLQEEIGSRFAPILAAARQMLIGLFDYLKNSPVLVDLATSFITAGIAVTGLITIIAGLSKAFLVARAAAVAFGVASNVALAGIPLLIGAIVTGLTLMALNIERTSQFFKGLGKVLQGAFETDFKKINEGHEQIVNSFKSTSDKITKINTEHWEGQNAEQKKAAEQAALLEAQHQANLLAIRQANIDLVKMQNENASQESIDLKTKEIETLKALDEQKTQDELNQLKIRQSQILALQAEQNNIDLEKKVAFAEIKSQTQTEIDQRDIDTRTELNEKQLAQLEAQNLSEAEVDRTIQTEIMQRRINQRNQELIDRKKYGETVATLTKVLGSDEVKGTKSAADDLVALQQSKNATLKSIGKAAAVASIIVNTAESAMNIYKGFSVIPFIGHALGIAGAAAAVAFGTERIGQVTSAANGGLITGGIAGQDSVPSLLMPGELVVPKQNFNQVVNAVQGNTTNSENADLLRSIDSKLTNPQTTIINGDMMTDDSYIDALVRKISDAIEFRNAKIVGVNA